MERRLVVALGVLASLATALFIAHRDDKAHGRCRRWNAGTANTKRL